METNENLNEIWKEIPGYEGYFEVSNLGNFRSKDRIIKYKQTGTRLYPGKPLKTELMQDGYSRIVLMKEAVKKRYMCHRLVAETFIDNPSNLPQVNHKDGNRSNNCVENLEWCTQSENELHAVNVLGKTMKGKTAPKKVYCVETDTIYNSMSEVIRWLQDHACVEGLNKAIAANRKYHGYTFEFYNKSSETSL